MLHCMIRRHASVVQNAEMVDCGCDAAQEGEGREGAGLVPGHPPAEHGCQQRQIYLAGASAPAAAAAGAQNSQRPRACSRVCQVWHHHLLHASAH